MLQQYVDHYIHKLPGSVLVGDPQIKDLWWGVRVDSADFRAVRADRRTFMDLNENEELKVLYV